MKRWIEVGALHILFAYEKLHHKKERLNEGIKVKIPGTGP
jgi:hypothetical protein